MVSRSLAGAVLAMAAVLLPSATSAAEGVRAPWNEGSDPVAAAAFYASKAQIGGFSQSFGGGESETSESNVDRGQLKAIGLSLLIPGLAQVEMGETYRGAGFMVAEAIFWAGWAAYRVSGNNLEESYIEMAGIFAGVPNPGGQSDDYYKRIADWNSSDDYNQLIRRDARAVYGDDIEGRETYYETNQVPADQVWNWESNAARQRYKDKRTDSANAFKRSRNFVGLMVANRVVSMIDAVLLRRRLGNDQLQLRLVPALESGKPAGRIQLSSELPW